MPRCHRLEEAPGVVDEQSRDRAKMLGIAHNVREGSAVPHGYTSPVSVARVARTARGAEPPHRSDVAADPSVSRGLKDTIRAERADGHIAGHDQVTPSSSRVHVSEP